MLRPVCAATAWGALTAAAVNSGLVEEDLAENDMFGMDLLRGKPGCYTTKASMA
jgi:hypothetical protein